MTIIVTVTKRIATISTTEGIVAGNTYPVTFVLDSEWTGSLYVRVRFGSQYYDIPMESSAGTADVQFPVGYPEVGIGVFSEALEICTNEVRVRLLRSILEQGVSVVDFDGDLYDQWAGEVTELLTDDAFDSESTRPVQNAVITAWKGTVPLDSAIVHKSGNETIAGVKTFEDAPVIADETVPQLDFGSEMGMYEPGVRGRILFVDDNGRVAAVEAWRSEQGSGVLKLLAGADGFPVSINVTPNFGYIETGNYYEPPTGTVIPDNVVIVSKNLATDSRLVHTSGDETIAGAKKFTSGMKVAQSGSDMLTLESTQASTDVAIKSDIIYSDMVNGVSTPAIRIRHRTYANHGDLWFTVYDPGRTRLSQFRMNAYADHGELMTDAPYYPVDGQGNPQALAVGQYVTSGNVAVDPRIVHTTGNEDIAGSKTFKSAVSSEGGFRWGYNLIVVPASDWMRIYTFEPPSSSTALRVLIQTIYAEAMIQSMNDAIACYVSTGLNISGSIRSNAGIEAKLALNSTTGKIELWIHRATGSGTMNIYCNFVQARGYRGAAAESVTGDEPIEGEVYSKVAVLGAVE